ncbi:MAG: hypothetical protein ABSC17_04830 [Thermacetogeniaceae bacterium]
MRGNGIIRCGQEARVNLNRRLLEYGIANAGYCKEGQARQNEYQ